MTGGRKCLRASCLGSLSGLRLQRGRTSQLTMCMMHVRLALLLALFAMLCLSFTLCSRLAYAIPTAPSAVAEEAADQLVSSALSTQQAHKERVNDLVKRWFLASSAKRARVPVSYKGMGQSITEPGSLDIVRLSGDLPQFAEHFSNLSGSEQLDKWLYYFGDYGDSFAGPASTDFMYRKDYLINSFTGDGTVGYGSMDERAQWMYWYDYFEGTTPNTGGGGGTLDGDYYYYPAITSYSWGTSANNFTFNGRQTTIYLSSADANVYKLLLPNQHVIFKVHKNVINSVPAGYKMGMEFDAFSYPNSITNTYSSKLRAYGTMTYNVMDTWTRTYDDNQYELKSYRISSSTGVYDTNTLYWTYDGNGTMTCESTTAPQWTLHPNDAWSNYGMAGKFLFGDAYESDGTGSGGSDEPVWPVYPQPDTPSSPTYNQTTVVNYSPTTNNTTTTTVDLTPILEAIRILNSNVIGYCDALQQELTSLHADIVSNIQLFTDWLGSWLKDIHNEINEANNWLSGIFYKIGAGSGSQPDPSVDDDSWLTWLEELLARIFEALPEGMQAFVYEVLDAFSALKQLFPFSIPWDIGMFLGLLQSDPVTPVFDLPYPYAYSGGQVIYASVRIDCTPWNGAAYIVRRLIFTLFAFWLAYNTKSLLGFGEDL